MLVEWHCAHVQSSGGIVRIGAVPPSPHHRPNRCCPQFFASKSKGGCTLSGLFAQALFGTPKAAEFVPGMIWLCLPFFVNVRVLDGLKDDLFDNVNHIIAVQWLTGVWCVFNVILDLPHKRFKTCCWVPGLLHGVEVFGTIG